jgi:hypothetical protein
MAFSQKVRVRGDQMEEEINAVRGILLGVLTGATVWLMIYAAAFL